MSLRSASRKGDRQSGASGRGEACPEAVRATARFPDDDLAIWAAKQGHAYLEGELSAPRAHLFEEVSVRDRAWLKTFRLLRACTRVTEELPEPDDASALGRWLAANLEEWADGRLPVAKRALIWTLFDTIAGGDIRTRAIRRLDLQDRIRGTRPDDKLRDLGNFEIEPWAEGGCKRSDPVDHVSELHAAGCKADRNLTDEEALELLRSFYAAHGRVPRRHEMFSGRLIGDWFAAFRIQCIKGKAPPDWLVELAEWGVPVPKPISPVWHQTLEKAVAFKRQNGRYPDPGAQSIEGFLGSWLERQALRWDQGSLEAEQIARFVTAFETNDPVFFREEILQRNRRTTSTPEKEKLRQRTRSAKAKSSDAEWDFWDKQPFGIASQRKARDARNALRRP